MGGGVGARDVLWRVCQADECAALVMRNQGGGDGSSPRPPPSSWGEGVRFLEDGGGWGTGVVMRDIGGWRRPLTPALSPVPGEREGVFWTGGVFSANE